MIALLPRLRLLAVAAVLALVFSATASAGPDAFKQKLNDSDMAAAKATVATKADLGSPGDWKGTTGLPAIGTDLWCANYRPKYSDLVVTGGFASRFQQPGYVIQSVSLVLQTDKMVQLHWQRAFQPPQFIDCVRATTRRTMPPATHLVSVRRLALPRIPSRLAAHAIGWRMVLDVPNANGVIRMAVDALMLLHGRTEISLSTTMPLSAASALFPNEIVIAKAISGRVRA